MEELWNEDNTIVNDYDKRLELGFILNSYSHCNQMFNIFNDFSKKSNKYNSNQIKIDWENIEKSYIEWGWFIGNSDGSGKSI